MKLSDVFTHVAQKELTAVDLPSRGSNQHEINGDRALRSFFGLEKFKSDIQWFYFSDEDTLKDVGEITFYDAREAHPTRTEWRLYYTGNFLDNAQPEDRLVLARTKTDLYGLVFSHNSALYQHASLLFDFGSQAGSFSVYPEEDLRKTDLEYLMRRILVDLGLDELVPAEQTYIELFHKRFGQKLPTTSELSEYARQLADASPLIDVDNTLLQWLDTEESLFKAWEHHEVEAKLKLGFSSVEEFIQYSLSVQNRRKSRMGQSLENHIEQILVAYGIRYVRSPIVEGNKKPDFIFPGKSEYEDRQYNALALDMLAAKSTCKDRWRQILNEASRIKTKHLCTLETGISENQTQEMQDSGIVLVIPKRFHSTYKPGQLALIHSVNDFIWYIKQRQSN